MANIYASPLAPSIPPWYILTMEFSKRHRAYIRDLPRLRASGQLRKVEGCAAVYVEGDKVHGKPVGLADLVASLRPRDIVVVVWLHVLAPLRTTYAVRPRDGLWDAIAAIEAKGASILEVNTGRQSTSKTDRDGMIRDAIEHITSAGRAAAGKVNGRKSPGRKPDEIDPDERKLAEQVWHDVRYKSNAAAMEAGPKGWSEYRYEKQFGKSGRGN